MRRTPGFLALSFVAATWPAAAHAQFTGSPTPNPTFVNVYWESGVGANAGTWNNDMAAPPSNFSGTEPGGSINTTDFIDSLLQSILLSNYYGQLTASTFATQMELPSIVVGQCGAPPNNLADAKNQWPAFVDCVLHLPQYSAGGPEDLSSTSIILNVFVPPWVLPASATAEFCAQHIGQNTNIWNLFQNGIDGHQSTFIPTVSRGADGGSGCVSQLEMSEPSIIQVLSHEIVEAATYGDFSDSCEWRPPNGQAIAIDTFFGFLGLNEYKDPINNSYCVPNEATQAPTLTVPQYPIACGSGAAMKLQAAFEGDRYLDDPWDVRAGFGSSMYVGVTDVTRNWSAGLSHYPNALNPVSISSQSWTYGTITVNGFGMGYTPGGALAAYPGDQFTMVAYDVFWGQPSSTTMAAEWPHSINLPAGDALSPFVGDSWSLLVQVLGNPACWLNPPGSNGAAIGDATVTFRVQDFADVGQTITLTTQAGGYANLSFTPQHAGPLTITPSSQTAAGLTTFPSSTYNVYPTITGISPGMGRVSGGTTATIYGTGFVDGGTSILFSPQAGATGTAAYAFNVVVNSTGTQATFTVPSSPIGTGLAGTVDVVVQVGGLSSHSPSGKLQATTYIYANAGQPIPAPYAFGNCASPLFNVSAFDATGASLAGTAMQIWPVSNPADVTTGLRVGIPFAVMEQTTYDIQISGFPPYPIRTPIVSNYCIPLAWVPNTGLPFPESAIIIAYTLNGLTDTWAWANAVMGSFSFTLNSPVSSEVATGIVAVVPTLAEEESLLNSARQTFINANGTPASVALAGSLFNVTARAQDGVFSAVTPEALLPVLGSITLQRPSGSSAPANQYRILHAAEIPTGVAWIDVTTSFGSSSLTAANLLDRGWYALARLSTPLALDSFPPQVPTCANGSCTPCETNGFSTNVASVCCSKQLSAGKCACLAVDQTCTDDQGCCSNWCSGYNSSGAGTCMQAPLKSACQENQYYCNSQPTQACECAGVNSSAACLGGTCCEVVFGTCFNGQSECCGGNTCVNGTCLITTGYGWCSQPQWTTAEQNAACASGNCNQSTGDCQ